MKKKLLSIFLSLSLIFSSIASMSVSFAEENSSTEKVIQQDGIEVKNNEKVEMDYKNENIYEVTDKASLDQVVEEIKNERDNNGLAEATIVFTQDIDLKGQKAANGSIYENFAGIPGVTVTLRSKNQLISISNLGKRFADWNYDKNSGFDYGNHGYAYFLIGNLILDNIVLDNREDANYFAQGNKIIFTENFTSKNDIRRIYGGGLGQKIVQEGGISDREIECDKTNIEIYSGKFDWVYGGSYNGNISGDTNVLIDGENVKIDNVYGGNEISFSRLDSTLTSPFAINGNTNVNFLSGKVNDVFGGSNNLKNDRSKSYGKINGSANLTLGNKNDKSKVVRYTGNIYGGSFYSTENKIKLEINNAIGENNTADIISGGENNIVIENIDASINGGSNQSWIFAGCSEYSTNNRAKSEVKNESNNDYAIKLTINGGSFEEIFSCCQTLLTEHGQMHEVNGNVIIDFNAIAKQITLDRHRTTINGDSILNINGGSLNYNPSVIGRYGEKDNVKGDTYVNFVNKNSSVKTWQLRNVDNIVVDNADDKTTIVRDYNSHNALDNCKNINIKNGKIAIKGKNEILGNLIVDGTLALDRENNTNDKDKPGDIGTLTVAGLATGTGNLYPITRNPNNMIIPSKPVIDEEYVYAKDSSTMELTLSPKVNGLYVKHDDKDSGDVWKIAKDLNPPIQEKYRATYDFISITRGKDLPESVTKLLPIDNIEYNEGDTITSIKPNDKEVEDGKWIFKGYDFETRVASKDNADENNNIKFVGKWEYVENVSKKYKVSYDFVNATNEDKITGVELDKLTLPPEVTKLLPNDTENNEEYSVGEEVDALKAAELKDKSIVIKYQNKDKEIDTYLEWKFDGYYVDGKKSDKLTIKDGENKFVGNWICKDVDLEKYKFESDSSKKLPDEILKLVPKTSGHLDIATDYKVELEYNDKKEIKVSDGTWKLVEWKVEYKDKEYDCPENPIEVHDDVEFIGVWHFTPNSTGGGGTGGGTVTPTPDPKPEEPDRIEGNDRIETSVETSKDLYPNGTNAVVLANAERYTDVLTADPFAIQEKASALLTYKYEIPEKTLKEIERLGAKKIYISGGYEAVSKKVVDELAAKGYEIFRFDGVDRYDTARKIAIKIREKGNTNAAELASGEDFPDALCMTPLAVKDNAPILLTKKDSIPKYTKQALAEWDIENIKIGGLDEAVSKEVEKQLKAGFEIEKNNKKDSNVYDGAKAVKRIGGEDRYETSAKLAAESYPESKLGVYATGEDFPDALIAGNYAGTKEAPVLLVKRDTLPEPIEKYTKESKIKKATIIGGVNAVSDKVFNLIKAIINR